MINKDYLKSLKPCEDRYSNYLDHYKDWSGSLEEFLNLDKLTHADRVWVFVRFIPKDKAVFFAADCAERVLHLYEATHPNDYRPRKAVEAARLGDFAAADAAAYAAAAAAAAADAAAYAYAAYAADADAYAAYAAAAYAARAADAARAAYAADAYAYAADASNKQSEQAAQLELMKKYAREALAKIRGE